MRFHDFLVMAGEIAYSATKRFAVAPETALASYRDVCASLPPAAVGRAGRERALLRPGVELGRGFPLVDTYALALPRSTQQALAQCVLSFWQPGHPFPFLLAAAALPRPGEAAPLRNEAVLSVVALSALAFDRQFGDDVLPQVFASGPVVVSGALPGFQTLPRPVLDEVFEAATLLALADAGGGAAPARTAA